MSATKTNSNHHVPSGYNKERSLAWRLTLNTDIMNTKRFIERENRILKILLRDGFFWMNYESRDCDGCYSYSANKYTSLEEFYEAEQSCIDGADGPFSFDLAPEREDGSYDLNEDWRGGSW